MDSGATIFIGSMAAAFIAGLLLAAAILLGHVGNLVKRIKPSRRPFVVDDTRDRSPWRDM